MPVDDIEEHHGAALGCQAFPCRVIMLVADFPSDSFGVLVGIARGGIPTRVRNRAPREDCWARKKSGVC
jgi:hypothetical protein